MCLGVKTKDCAFLCKMSHAMPISSRTDKRITVLSIADLPIWLEIYLLKKVD